MLKKSRLIRKADDNLINDVKGELSNFLTKSMLETDISKEFDKSNIMNTIYSFMDHGFDASFNGILYEAVRDVAQDSHIKMDELYDELKPQFAEWKKSEREKHYEEMVDFVVNKIKQALMEKK